MTPTDTIERVARAIHAARPATPWDGIAWKDLPDHEKGELRGQAVAAIEAMREPSEEMLRVGVDRNMADGYWRLMIDAALGRGGV